MIFLILFAVILPEVRGHGSFIPLTLNSKSTTKYVSICGEYTYFDVYMPYPCSDLNIEVFPTSGKPNIYVSKANIDGDPYPTKSKLTWAADVYGDNKVSISHWDPESSPGWYYIGIYNDCTYQSKTASYSITAYTSDDNSQDIFSNKKLSMNKLIPAEDYAYYRFCVPACADVKVTLQNCMDYNVCGKTYSYPELLVTRTNRMPDLNSYSYKLATTSRRSIVVNHTDPSSRDHNGYMTGSYYVGVYGWCTPDSYVNDWEADGPCSYAKNTVYNVTVDIYPLDSAQCTDQHLIYKPSPSLTKIKSGDVITGVVPVNQYIYYTIDVPDPCETLNIWIGDSDHPDYTVPELAVGKWPNTRPTMDNLEWTSYNWAYQNLTISAWDADFDGGYVCGPNKNSICSYTIGVVGYSSNSSFKSVKFTMKVSLTPQHKIFGVPQLHQTIAPNGMNQYAFCVRSKSDVVAELVSWNTLQASQCPNSYSSLEMVVSKFNPVATSSDLVWRLGHGDTQSNAVYLLNNDADTRLGSYYLNVWGYCTNSSTCTNVARCGAPCSNLQKSQYSLVVSNNVVYDATADQKTYLGSCPTSAATTTTTSSSSSSNDKNGLSEGAKAGIAIAVIVFVLAIIAFVVYFCLYKNKGYSNANSVISGDGKNSELTKITAVGIPDDQSV